MHISATDPSPAGRPRLLTLGGLTLTNGPQVPVGAAAQRRPLALLAVLARAGERGVSRDRLQALLWPESDAERARKVLAQTVYAIRRDLHDPGVVLGTAELRLNTASLAADVVEFEHAVAVGEWERAVTLYAGPFLDGVHLSDAPEFERWVEGERERLAQRALDALERLALDSEGRGEWEVAAGWWRRRAALDPLSGRTAAHLMRALAEAGDVAEALRHARVHETLVRDELGAPPDPIVSETAERLRTGRPLATPPTSHVVRPAPPPGRPTPGDPPPLPAPSSGDGTGPPHASPAVASRGDADADVGGDAGRADAAGEASPAESRRRARGWMWLGGAVGLAIVGAIVVALMGRRPAGAAPDRTLVVVVPFDVADADLVMWREGMVDVLARNLDGAGPVRTVSPTVVAREWTGHADRETVRAFAGGYGAGTAVYGQLLAAGADSVRASVTLLDVGSGQPLVELRRVEATRHMERLTDSLTVDILRALGRVIPLGAARAAPLGGATSLEVLRAFLQGEQFYRRAAWDSAAGHYRRAVAVDSAFALAWRRLGHIASWQRLLQDSLTEAHLLRAGAANHGLGPRDSLLVVADSLSAAASTTPHATVAFGLTRRLFATLDEAVRRYPDDPEVWFALGEARYHRGFGPVVGVRERATLDAFDHAIALDSAFAPAYHHAVELGLNLGGAALGLRYARLYLARNPAEAAHRGIRLVEQLLDPTRGGRVDAERLLDTAQTSTLVWARTILRRWPDSTELAVGLSRRLAVGLPSEYPLFADRRFMQRRLAEQLAFRGHLSEAQQVLGPRDLPILAELAYLGAVPPAIADPVLGRWAREDAALARLALSYWSAAHDTATIAALLEGAARRASAAAAAAGEDAREARARAAYDTASAAAHLALARRDSSTALRRFAVLPDTLCSECYLDRLTKARLLTAAGRGREALMVLDEALDVFLTPVEVLFAVERARAAAQAGDVGAAEACEFARAAWARGDQAARSIVAEACGGAP